MAELETPPLGVLEASPPRFGLADAEAIAAERFGVHGRASDLGSERDQTFLIDGGAGEGGVLKVSNLAEHAAVLDLEAAGLLHIAAADPGLPVAHQRLGAGLDPSLGLAARRPVVNGPDGPHFARLFERLGGRSVTLGSELDDAALVAFGATAARLARALRGFFHPAAGRTLQWDTKHAAGLRPLAAAIDDDRRRGIVERVLDRYRQRVTPAWPRLRAQVVHGDLALDNVLVDDRGMVTGIVDFGDIVHTSLLADLGAAMASALRGRPQGDLFRAGRLFVDGYTSCTPLDRLERELLPDVLAARMATVVTISAWRVRRYPENAEYIQAWDAGTWPILELFDELGADAVAGELGAPRPPSSTAALAERRRRALGAAITPPTYAQPVHLGRGDGPWLFEAGGRRLLDAYNNVPVVGHCHPRVTEAVVAQTRTLNTHARYLYEPLVELAERLVALMPAGSGLDTVMVVNSGSEANDLAWRIATDATGRGGGIVTAFAYHGVTEAVAALSPEEWPPDGRPDHVQLLTGADGSGEVSGPAAEAAIGRLGATGPAALFLDSGFTSDGILVPDEADVRAAADAVRTAGGLVVADEVQAGHGRTGEHLWAFECYGLAPDVVTLGKPMGNGYPVAALIARGELVDCFAERTEFFSTFGGNPVAAVAALTVLDVIDDERLTERACRTGAVLRAALDSLRRRHQEIREVRGRGLLVGVELAGPAGGPPEGAFAAEVVDGMRERGVLVGRTGPAGDVLKIRPPLVFGEEHVPLVVDALDGALSAARA